MCRILSIVGKIDYKAESKALEKFRCLAQYGKIAPGVSDGHKDGWGMAACRKGKLIFAEKSIANAYKDKEYASAVDNLEQIEKDIFIAHLRKGTVGKKRLENTHPFMHENFIFCQNGTIFGSEKIPLKSRYKKLLTGDTDSEKLFLYILQKIQTGKKSNQAAIKKAINEAVAFVRKNFDYTSFNFVLSDGKHIWVAREINEKNSLVKEKNLLDYYTLFRGTNRKKNYQIIASEKIDISGVSWRLMKNHELMVI